MPGPKEPNALHLKYLLMPLLKELKELWQDVVAMRKLTGFISHSGDHFCNFCTIHKAQIEEIGPQFHYTRSYQNHKSTLSKWLWATPKQEQALFSEYAVQYSILEDLPYWDATRMVNLDIMHNLILGILKDHAAFKLCNPESKSKVYFRSRRKSKYTHPEKRCSRNNKSVTPHYFPKPKPCTENPSSGSVDFPSFDADYIPTSEIPSELDISALSDHQIEGRYSIFNAKSEEVVILRQILQHTKKNGQSEEISNELTKNTFHLISAINIATSCTGSMDDTTEFAEHWKIFRHSNQHLFPKQKIKPNHHFAEHIAKLFQHWGPEQPSATWGYDRLIGVFAKMPTNNKICILIDKINIFTLIKHMN
ncbi:hypothetical protein O181_059426 [Austropuccinia psidii MF-1]|uniref:Uncharacterized protein n=1 Tax=Austropuccinia psidii MF-1 TaxID=1389203 RepID=A0A9Q3EIY2_9BASI|nr:hypothetical protein [Austropuccinia psidii MF-1]